MKVIGYIIVDLYNEIVSKMYKLHERGKIYGRVEKMNSEFAEKPYSVKSVYIKMD